MFNLEDVNNITIIGVGATVDMNAQGYKGEWRHNVNIVGSTNITIKGLKSIRSGGDGFYIGRSSKNKKVYCENITLDGVMAQSNRRQGLSIISVKKCKVINSKFLNTSGTAPAAGIDLEPDKPDEFLEDILIRNCFFKHNDGGGILFALPRLRSGARITVEIDRCKSIQDRYGILVVHRQQPSTGKIRISNMTIEQSRLSAILIADYEAGNAPIEILSPKIVNPNMSKSTNKVNAAAISIGIAARAKDIGDVRIENMTLQENVPRVPHALYVFDLKNQRTTIQRRVRFVNSKLTWNRKRGSAIQVSGDSELQDRRELR